MAKIRKTHLPKLTADEVKLFRESMSQVARLEFEEKETRSPTVRPNASPKNAQPVAPGGIIDHDRELFYRPGISRRTLNDLRKGRFPRAAAIDLHGLTSVQTSRTLQRFVSDACQTWDQCLLVITGRGSHSPDGYSPIRQVALETLRELSVVQAYCCARPNEGGSGAFYVLTRRLDR